MAPSAPSAAHPSPPAVAPPPSSGTGPFGRRSRRRHGFPPADGGGGGGAAAAGTSDAGGGGGVGLEAKHGPLHPRLGKVHNHIGTQHFHHGDYGAARTSFDRALGCYKRSYARRGRWRGFFGAGGGGSSGPAGCPGARRVVARPRRHLQPYRGRPLEDVLWRTGKPDAAIRYLDRALEMQEGARASMVRGEEDADEEGALQMAHTRYNLGCARALRGDYAGALRALKRARRTYERALGPFHIEVARVEDALGAAHASQGEADPALKCHQNALRIKGATLEVYDPSVRNSLMNVAAAYGRLGKFKAEVFFREVWCALKLGLYMTRTPAPRTSEE